MSIVTDERPAANVIEALVRVQRDLPAIPKDTPSGQGYTYRGIEAITAEAQGLFGRHGVVFVPKVLRRTVTELVINNRPWTQDELEVVYTVYGPGGIEDHIEVGPVWGLGRDNSDKGANKAMTQALKYAMLQTLCISDAKDDGDRERHETDRYPERAPAPEPTADERFHLELVERVRAADEATKADVRRFCLDNDFGNVTPRWTPEMDRAIASHLDHLLATPRGAGPNPAGAERATTATGSQEEDPPMLRVDRMNRAELVAEISSFDPRARITSKDSTEHLQERLAALRSKQAAARATEALASSLAGGGQPSMLPDDPF